MKKFYLWLTAMIAVIGFTACSSNNDGGGEEGGGTNAVTGIKNLSPTLLGDWDEGFATSKGSFLIKEYGAPASAKLRKA